MFEIECNQCETTAEVGNCQLTPPSLLVTNLTHGTTQPLLHSLTAPDPLSGGKPSSDEEPTGGGESQLVGNHVEP